jgi:hypothetical protein
VDTANPTFIYIYDATAKSWSNQTVVTNSFDYSNFAAILDHDTNFFCAFVFLFSLYLVNRMLNLPLSSLDAYSSGDTYSLDMALLKAGTGTAIPWNSVQQPDLSANTSGTIIPGANTAGYQPVLALAQNHVQFLNVPGLPAGSCKIFVIHCMFSTLPFFFFNLNYYYFAFFLQSHACNPLCNHSETSQPHMEKQLLSFKIRVSKKSSLLYRVMDLRLMLSMSR